MVTSALLRQTGFPDIRKMEENKDIFGLIALLSRKDYRVRNEAGDALGRLGQPAIVWLSRHAVSGRKIERLGVMEALSRIRNPACIPSIRKVLQSDSSEEMRAMAAITLGEVGDPSGVGDLVDALRDRNKVVRFGAAKALKQIGWSPENPENEVRFRISLQEWGSIPGLPFVPVGVLEDYVDDPDPRIRESVIFLLGYQGDTMDGNICDKVLRDPDPRVRWKASLVLPRCHVSPLLLPSGTFRRRREGKNVYVAAFLNLFFPGLGYNYLGKWWGFLLFQLTINSVMILTLVYGSFIPYLLSYSFSSITALHTWRMMKGMPDI